MKPQVGYTNMDGAECVKHCGQPYKDHGVLVTPGSPEWLRDLSKNFVAETRAGLLIAADELEKHKAP